MRLILFKVFYEGAARRCSFLHIKETDSPCQGVNESTPNTSLPSPADKPPLKLESLLEKIRDLFGIPATTSLKVTLINNENEMSHIQTEEDLQKQVGRVVDTMDAIETAGWDPKSGEPRDRPVDPAPFRVLVDAESPRGPSPSPEPESQEYDVTLSGIMEPLQTVGHDLKRIFASVKDMTEGLPDLMDSVLKQLDRNKEVVVPVVQTFIESAKRACGTIARDVERNISEPNVQWKVQTRAAIQSLIQTCRHILVTLDTFHTQNEERNPAAGSSTPASDDIKCQYCRCIIEESLHAMCSNCDFRLCNNCFIMWLTDEDVQTALNHPPHHSFRTTRSKAAPSTVPSRQESPSAWSNFRLDTLLSFRPDNSLFDEEKRRTSIASLSSREPLISDPFPPAVCETTSMNQEEGKNEGTSIASAAALPTKAPRTEPHVDILTALFEMGFHDVQRNSALITKHNGRMSAVLEELLESIAA